MELKRSFDCRKIVAAICLFVAVFCFAKGLNTADAVSYEISGNLSIPSIGLNADVTTLRLENNSLKTPGEIVGSFSRYDNTSLLIGHSTTVFTNLENVKIGDEFTYEGDTFVVKKIETLKKEDVSMDSLLAPNKKKTVILMTCTGELYQDGGASHRLIITATSE